MRKGNKLVGGGEVWIKTILTDITLIKLTCILVFSSREHWESELFGREENDFIVEILTTISRIYFPTCQMCCYPVDWKTNSGLITACVFIVCMRKVFECYIVIS